MMSSAELISSVDLVAKEAKGYFVLATGLFHGVLCRGRPVQLASHLPGGAKSPGEHADAMCTAGIRQANLLPHS